MRTKKLWCLLVCACLILGSAQAQRSDRDATEPPTTYFPLYGGLEQDVLPYILKGYFLSGWIGMRKTRLRAAYAQAVSPAFFLKEGISYECTQASGVGIEFFFKKGFEGFWVGPGLGYWWNTVKGIDPEDQRQIGSFIFSTGGGYNYFPFRKGGFYISPWVAAHFRLSGNRRFLLGDTNYKPLLVTPEISLKIGYRFGKVPEKPARLRGKRKKKK